MIGGASYPTHSDQPLVAIGIPVRSAAHLAESLDSLLAQTFAAVRLVVLDDCSDDEVEELVGRYAGRVEYLRSAERLGLTVAWRLAWETARRRFPSIRYYAWGSDHDVWHPDWVAELIDALEREPDAVLAYPKVRRLSEQGAPLRRAARRFDTLALEDPVQRLRSVGRAMRAGDMVYGLFRVGALETTGGLPMTLLPDRLLLGRLSLEGRFVQVERVLWSRRTFDGVSPSLGRQRRRLFPEHPPPIVLFPWWLQHLVWFYRSLPSHGRRRRARLTGLYIGGAMRAVARQRWTSRLRRMRKRRKALSLRS